MGNVATNTKTGETLTNYLNRRASALLANRQPSDARWKIISDVILPFATRFFTTDKNRTGARRNTSVINTTATSAVGTGSAGMMSGITSPSRPWFKLQTPNTELNKAKPVRVWLDQVRNLMSELFIKSNLYTTLPLVYDDLLAFGTSAFAEMEDMSGDDDSDVIRFYHFPVGSYVLSVSHRGSVDGCFRNFKMTVAQLEHQFGLENCSTVVQEAYRTGRYDQEIDVVHAVERNPDADETKLESRYLPYRSIFYEKSGNPGSYLEMKGYHEMCIMAPRWKVNGEDTYGTSPGMVVLGDVLQLQQMEKRKLQMLDMLLDPPRNASASLRNEYIGRLSGEITFVPDNAMAAKSEPNYIINPPLQYLSAEIEKVEQRIKHGLFEDLFLMITGIDRGNVTATEIQARQQEKMMALGPVLERLNDEMLDPIIRRTYSIMERNGLIPIPPPEVQNQELVVEYISIMAQAQKLNGVVGIERVVGFVGGLSAQNPESLDKLDFDETIDAYADMVGVPPNIIKDKAQVAPIRAQRAQAQRTQQALQMAQQGADAAKTMADTQVTTPSMLQALSGALQQAGPQAGAA
ncbi:MAG: phage tail protein [Acidobacteriota bacterium]|nr:phage tail protein [Acidobacteriota bacterium]